MGGGEAKRLQMRSNEERQKMLCTGDRKLSGLTFLHTSKNIEISSATKCMMRKSSKSSESRRRAALFKFLHLGFRRFSRSLLDSSLVAKLSGSSRLTLWSSREPP